MNRVFTTRSARLARKFRSACHLVIDWLTGDVSITFKAR